MMIGHTFHTYNLNHALQREQLPAKPAENASPHHGNASGQTQPQSNQSSLATLGQGRLL